MTCYVLWYYNNAIFHTVSYHYILHKLFSISFDHFAYSFNLWFEIHAFTLVCRIKMRATCMCYLIMEVPSSGLLKRCTACLLVVLLPWVADLNAGAGCLVAGVPGDLVPRIHTLGILRRLRCSCGFWQEGWIVGPDTILYNGLVIKVNQTVATRVKPGGQS